MANVIVFDAPVPPYAEAELWLYGGAGVPVEVMPPAGANADFGPGYFANVGDVVYMSGDDAEGNDGLWVLRSLSGDLSEVYGVTGTTQLLPDDLTAYGSIVVFFGDTPSGSQLWTSNGTTAGTAPVAGAPSGGELTPYDGYLLFAGGASNPGLWRTDGTSAGTYQIPVLQNGVMLTGFSPADLTVIGDVAYFNAADTSYLNGLWVTSGTTASTHEISIAGASTSVGINPSYITQFGSDIAFAGVSASFTYDLWVYNPTQGTATDITVPNVASFGLYPTYITAFDNALYFNGIDSAGRHDLWTSDGSAAGTHIVDVLGASTSANGLDPSAFAVLNGVLYFNGDDSNGMDDLWSYDGTEASPQIVYVPPSQIESYGLAPTDITAVDLACYLRGTRVATPGGEVAVEDLQIGDNLRTASGVVRPLVWIGRRSYDGRFAAGNRAVLPIVIAPGALADGVPCRELAVSPLHAMYIDGVLVPAAALVNGVTIVQAETAGQVDYFHLELETHDLILAEGAPSETFVDDESRGMFQNATQFPLLYPDAVSGPACYCAPRVEDGEALEAIRERIAARARPQQASRAAPLPNPLEGWLDLVRRDRIEGWARDGSAADTPMVLNILDNGVVAGTVQAGCYRDDLAGAGIGHGRHGFALAVPGGFAPDIRHVVQVQRQSDGCELPGSPWVLEPVPLVEPATPPTAPHRLWKGHLEVVTRERIEGWAWDGQHPHRPVALQVLNHGVIIARVLANRFRADLLGAGVGDGWHGFCVTIPGGLPPTSRHVITVRHETTGWAVGEQPGVIEPATAFDATLEQAVAGAVASIDSAETAERAVAFLMAQADRVLQRSAAADGEQEVRLAHRELRRRSGTSPQTHNPRLRALVLADAAPTPDAVAHMRAMQGLGYAVSFAAADFRLEERAAEALAADGIVWWRAPFYASVEEVLRRQAGCFDSISLVQVSAASKYLALSRHYCPQARILFAAGDLHHLRLARQAEAERRPELMALSRQMRMAEFAAARSADAVLVASQAAAVALRGAVPDTKLFVLGPHAGAALAAALKHPSAAAAAA